MGYDNDEDNKVRMNEVLERVHKEMVLYKKCIFSRIHKKLIRGIVVDYKRNDMYRYLE